jgi:ubiquinone/menaquinone biosynthesis C-methylase UbiE
MNKNLIRELCPPLVWRTLANIKNAAPNGANDLALNAAVPRSPDEQDLGLYWDEKMAKLLDEWGEDNVWNEIQLLLANCHGRVLDIACGTGKTAEVLRKFANVTVYGCDISDFLISKAIERGIPAEHLKICDATKSGYADDEFDYSYSIGSLEHFTEDGIRQFVAESHRITRYASFHMLPTSRSETDEGWMKTLQSFFNNQDSWWVERFQVCYPEVHVVPSKWEDPISHGRWFICVKDRRK